MHPAKNQKINAQKLEREFAKQAHILTERWQDVLWSQPTDHEQLEKQALKLYANLGLSEPKVFWCDSPFQAFAIPHLIDRFGSPQTTFEQFWDQCEEHYIRYLPKALLEKLNVGTLQNRLSKHFPLGRGYCPDKRPIDVFDKIRSGIISYFERIGFKWNFRYIHWLPQNLTAPYELATRQLYGDLNFPHALKELLFARSPGDRNLDFQDPVAVERGVSEFLRVFFDLGGDYFEAGVRPDDFRKLTEWRLSRGLSELANMQLIFELGSWEDPIASALSAWGELAHAAWWMTSFAECVFLCGSPTLIELDDLQQFHCQTGPAISFADGYGMHFWNGTPTPSYVAVTTPTVELIESESNIELRRIMLSRFGTQEFLFASGAKVFHVDATGTLYRKEMAGEEAIMMVHVVNKTPEPDGNFHDFFLRVPPSVLTAREAIAWTFGLSADEYEPQQET